MSNVITSDDIKRAQAMAQTANRSELDVVKSQFAEYQQFANTVRDIVFKASDIIGMKQQVQGGQQTQSFAPGRPTQPSHNNPQVVYREKEMELDKQKVVDFMSKLLIEDLPNVLPQEVKEKRIEELIGSNWQNFTVKYMGMDVPSQIVLDKLADEVMAIYPMLKKNG